MVSTVAGALSCHQPVRPESSLAELTASLMANRTAMDISIPGSPVAEQNRFDKLLGN